MSTKKHILICRAMALVLLLNIFGITLGAYASFTDPHDSPVELVSSGVNSNSSDGGDAPDCAHGCHMAHHFVGQVGAALTYAPPPAADRPSAVPLLGPAFFCESLFRPPRALA